MNSTMREKIKVIWGMHGLTVDEIYTKISNHPDFKFLLTSAGIWLLVRWMMALWIGFHAIYFVSRIFILVLH